MMRVAHHFLWQPHCGKEEVALALINEFQCDPLAVDNDGDTPLHLCAAEGHGLQVLLSPSAPHMVRNSHGNTPTAECRAMLDDHFSAVRELQLLEDDSSCYSECHSFRIN